MPITREKNDLDKRWTWFLFLAANVVVLIGCAVTWYMFGKGNSYLNYLPTLICDLAAIILAGVFMYFEIKEIAPKVMHFQKKWLYWYIAAFISFVVAILFNVLFFLCYLTKIDAHIFINNPYTWQLVIYLVITMVFTLFAIGFQRYARFRIDLDIYRRKRGENPNENPDQKDAKNDQNLAPKNDQKTAEKSDKNEPKKEPKKPSASGGLLDQME